MNYQELYDKYQKELESEKLKEARIEARLHELTDKLDIEVGDDIEKSLLEMKENLTKQLAEKEAELQELIKKYEQATTTED